MIAIVLAAAAAAGATPAGKGDPCRKAATATACFAAHQEATLQTYRIKPIEQHVAGGDRLFRIFYLDAYRRHFMEVELTRIAGQEPTLTVRRPGEGAGSLSTAIPLSEWDRAVERAGHFERAMVPLPPPPASEGIALCLDGWLDIVEAGDPTAEPDRRVRRRVESTCEDGLAVAFARYAADAAVRLLPSCALLADAYGSHLRALQACAGLTGDRVAAAEVLKRALDLRYAPEREAIPVRYFFDDAAVVERAGAAPPTPGHAGAAWLEALGSDPQATFVVEGARGENAERVRVKGHLEQWRQVPDRDSVLWTAEVEQIWTLGPDRQFSVARATIGAFRPAPQVCPPGYLTGAEEAVEKRLHCRY